jgi:hypothetical protein
MPWTTSLDLRDLADPFNAWCAQRRVSRSLAIRQLVAAALGSDLQLSRLAPPGANPASDKLDGLGSTDADPPLRFTLRLTHSQRKHLRARAATAGISCSRYIVAAVTACESDARAIAGQDAVQSLNRSNDLLAQAVLGLSAWRHQGEMATSTEGGGQPDPVRDLLDAVREHLARSAAVASDVELTRLGRAPRGRIARRTDREQPRGARRRPAALG